MATNSCKKFDWSKTSDCPFQIDGDKTIFHGRWLGVQQVDFVDPRTKSKGVWQVAYRTTTPAEARVDGVTIIPILKKGEEKYFVCIKQYRIPLMAWSLEFPAGLIDAAESIEEAAVRELLEETGYKATSVLSCTKGIQALDPGISNDSINICTVQVDGDLEVNQNPTQNLGEGEKIEVLLIPVAKMQQRMAELTEEGVVVEALVYSFAIGHALGMGAAV